MFHSDSLGKAVMSQLPMNNTSSTILDEYTTIMKDVDEQSFTIFCVQQDDSPHPAAVVHLTTFSQVHFLHAK